MSVLQAPPLINDKKMLKTKRPVPGRIISSTHFYFQFSWHPHTHLLAPSSSHNWNTLFLGTSAVADAIAEKYNITKSQVLDHVSDAAASSSIFVLYHNSFQMEPYVHCEAWNTLDTCLCPLLQESKESVAVRMALGETQIVQETRQFLQDNGVSLDSFSQVCLIESHLYFPLNYINICKCP